MAVTTPKMLGMVRRWRFCKTASWIARRLGMTRSNVQRYINAAAGHSRCERRAIHQRNVKRELRRLKSQPRRKSIRRTVTASEVHDSLMKSSNVPSVRTVRRILSEVGENRRRRSSRCSQSCEISPQQLKELASQRNYW